MVILCHVVSLQTDLYVFYGLSVDCSFCCVETSQFDVMPILLLLFWGSCVKTLCQMVLELLICRRLDLTPSPRSTGSQF